MWKILKNITNKTTPILLFGSEPFASFLRCSNIKNYKYDWIYQKAHSTNFLNAKKQPLRNYETISVFYEKQCLYNPQMEKGKPYSCTSTSCKASKTISADYNIFNYPHKNNGTRYPLSITKKYSLDNYLFLKFS